MIQYLTASALTYLAAATPAPGGAGVVPNEAPSAPGQLPQVSTAINTIISWTMYGAVSACGLAAIIAAGFAGWARMTARPQHFERGVNASIWALGSGFLIGIAIPLVNTFYGLSGGG